MFKEIIMKHKAYIPVLVAALAVLLVGCWNPKTLQSKTPHGIPSGYPSWLWLGVIALVAGSATVMLMDGNGKMYETF